MSVENKTDLILKVCTEANIARLNSILLNVEGSRQRESINNMFIQHMQLIAGSCTLVLSPKWTLTELFIKQLHKVHYPPDYSKKIKSHDGSREILIMRAGQYKTIKNFDHVLPGDVKKEMRLLVKSYNKKINKKKPQLDVIINFILNFFRIHPFGDGNGSVASILFDLLLIKNDFKPVFLKGFYVNFSYKEMIYNAIEQSISKNNPVLFKKVLFDLGYHE